MAEQYIGEIRMFGGDYAPDGWALCDGQSLSIADNRPLYDLIGTAFGGDGRQTFAPPDLRGRIPLHVGKTNHGEFTIGQKGGAETVTLEPEHLPNHRHAAGCNTTGTTGDPTGNVWAGTTNGKQFSDGPADKNLIADSIEPTGGGKPHDNVMPYLAVSFIIAIAGEPITAPRVDRTLGEIRLFPYGTESNGWIPCDGRLLKIADFQALFSILGAAFGGDGRGTFAVPDLRGRTPVHPGDGIKHAQSGGEAAHTLTEPEMPAHSHKVFGTTISAATNALFSSSGMPRPWAKRTSGALPYAPTVNAPLGSSAISAAGDGNPHSNMQPYCALQFCICTMGIFPTRGD
jgi:microcystin-dependent protein